MEAKTSQTHELQELPILVPPEVPVATITPAVENVIDYLDAPPDATTNPRSKLRVAAILTALYLSLFVAALDATIVATAVPVISHDLKSATGYTWIGGTYLLANACAAPVWAKMSDIWGRKLIMLAAIAVFFVSSLICAIASNMRMLLVGRAFQGAAGGGLMLLVHVAISDLFSMRQRSLFMGLTEAIWAFSGGIGPVLGGVFASLVSWRWCFWVNLPICGLAFALILLFLNIKHEQTSFVDGMKSIDWLGLLSFLAVTLMILLGLDFGGGIFPWNSATVIALLVVGTCMIGAFVYSEARIAKYPLIPMRLFRNRSNVASLGVGFLHGLAFMPAEYYMPLYYQSVMEATPLRSGILLLPLIVAAGLSGIAAGVIIHRTGRYLELIWVGFSVLCLGMGLFTTLDADTSIAKAIGFQVIFGLGNGLIFEPPLIAIQCRSDQQDVATATSTLNFVRNIALSMSVIIGGVVFQNSMDNRSSLLAKAGLPQNIIEQLSGKEAAANVMLGATLSDPLQRRAVQEAFAWSLHNMWIMYTVIAGLGVIVGLFVGKAHLTEEHTETVTGIKKNAPTPTT